MEQTTECPYIYNQLLHSKAAKHIQWGMSNFFQNWCWENWTAACRKMELEYYLAPETKTNSKRI